MPFTTTVTSTLGTYTNYVNVVTYDQYPYSTFNTSGSVTTTLSPYQQRVEVDVEQLKALLEGQGFRILRRETGQELVLDAAEDYRLPDGAKLVIDGHGNYKIEDAAARVTYKANRIREFNPYVSASDVLEKFITEAGRLGVEQTRLLKLPVEAFINWLVREAAAKDGDSVAGLPDFREQLALPAPG